MIMDFKEAKEWAEHFSKSDDPMNGNVAKCYLELLKQHMELRAGLSKIENSFPHSSSCNLSEYVKTRSKKCNCGTWRIESVKIARQTLE